MTRNVTFPANHKSADLTRINFCFLLTTRLNMQTGDLDWSRTTHIISSRTPSDGTNGSRSLSLSLVVVIGGVSFRRSDSRHFKLTLWRRSVNLLQSKGEREDSSERKTIEYGGWKENPSPTSPFNHVWKHVGLVTLQHRNCRKRQLSNSGMRGPTCVDWTIKEIKVDWFTRFFFTEFRRFVRHEAWWWRPIKDNQSRP